MCFDHSGTDGAPGSDGHNGRDGIDGSPRAYEQRVRDRASESLEGTE